MVGNEVQISLASEADAETIAKILSEAFAEFDDKYTPEALRYVTPVTDEVRRRFAEGPIWLAFKNDDIVGTVSVVSEPNRLYIRSMAVSPAAQGMELAAGFWRPLRTMPARATSTHCFCTRPISRPMR